MVLQIGETSVVLTTWGASKVSELIKNKAVLADWTVYDSGGTGGNTTDKTTGAYWWVLKHPTDNFYVFLTDRYDTRVNYYARASFFVYIEIGNDWNSTTNAWVTGTNKYSLADRWDFYGLPCNVYNETAIAGFTCWLEYAFDDDTLAFYMFMDQSTLYWKRSFGVIGKLKSYEGIIHSVPYYTINPCDLDSGKPIKILDGTTATWFTKAMSYSDENSTWYLDEILIVVQSDPTQTSPTFTGTRVLGKTDTSIALNASRYDSNASCGSDMQTLTVTATVYKYLICRIHQRHYDSGGANCSGAPAYATSFGTTYNSWGIRTNL